MIAVMGVLLLYTMANIVISNPSPFLFNVPEEPATVVHKPPFEQLVAAMTSKSTIQ